MAIGHVIPASTWARIRNWRPGRRGRRSARRPRAGPSSPFPAAMSISECQLGVELGSSTRSAAPVVGQVAGGCSLAAKPSSMSSG